MTLLPHIISELINLELEECRRSLQSEKFKISEYNDTQIFTVEMISKVDDEKYFLEVNCENYNEWPPLLEFIDNDGNRGTKKAYPLGTDSFFHGMPCICNPCSRKAYLQGGPHFQSWNLIGWKQNPQVNSLTNLERILSAIYNRINNPIFYKGRMI